MSYGSRDMIYVAKIELDDFTTYGGEDITELTDRQKLYLVGMDVEDAVEEQFGTFRLNDGSIYTGKRYVGYLRTDEAYRSLIRMLHLR